MLEYAGTTVQFLGLIVATWVLYHTLNTWLEVQRPRVSVSLEVCKGSLLVLTIRNTGNSLASNIKMRLDGPLIDSNGFDLRQRYPFRMGSPVLPAGQQVSYLVNSIHAFFRQVDGDKDTEQCSKVWYVDIEYWWSTARKKYKERITLSADCFRGGLVPTKSVEESMMLMTELLRELKNGMVTR